MKLDLQQLKSLSGVDDVEMLVTVAEALAQEAPTLLAGIEHGLAQLDEKEIVFAAHTLEGACRVMLVASVAKSAESIEQFGRNGNLEGVKRELPHLKELVNEMLRSITQFISENRTI